MSSDLETACPCENDDGTSCKASSGYLCTLDAGHDGDHIACSSTEHRLLVWAQEEL